MSGSPELIQRDVELATEAHRRLLADLDRLLADRRLDVAAPSMLPGWTVGHVITHVTNSGDGHVRMFEAAARGERAAQYPHGVDGRSADIASGAVRSAAEQVAALGDSIVRLEASWAASSWRGTGMLSTGADVPLADLPFRRLREVALHHIDLGIGASFADLPGEYVRRELRQLGMQWQARQPMGLTALPAAALALAPPDRLAWLTGRAEVAGLARADVW